MCTLKHLLQFVIHFEMSSTKRITTKGQHEQVHYNYPKRVQFTSTTHTIGDLTTVSRKMLYPNGELIIALKKIISIGAVSQKQIARECRIR